MQWNPSIMGSDIGEEWEYFSFKHDFIFKRKKQQELTPASGSVAFQVLLSSREEPWGGIW